MDHHNWLNKEEAKVFIGKSISFYLEKWKHHSGTAFKGWNWAAMLFSFYWLAYRKMYLEAFLFYIITLIIIRAGFLLNHSLWGLAISVLFCILMGVFGNFLYWKKALRTFEKAGKFANMHDRFDYLTQAGGVSILSLAVCIIIAALFESLYLRLLSGFWFYFL